MNDVLSDEALEDLERKRQAATPGPWKHDNRTKPHLGVDPYVTTLAEEVVATFSLEAPDDKALANLDYIAAANPEAVGKLIAEVKANRAHDGLHALIVKAPDTPEARAAMEAKVEALKKMPPQKTMLGAMVLDDQQGLRIAAEFFEAMDASGDREPLTPSAIACLLREYAADRRKRATGGETP